MALSLIIQRRLTPQTCGLICFGIPGRFASDWVADLKRNQWPVWCGIVMNQGIWKNLEEYIRKWAIERDELYIFTGPIYGDETKKKIGKNEVAVPTHLYKIVYDPIKVEAIAFIMPNEKLNSKDMPKYIVTIREVEEKTGLNFLSKISKHTQDVIETKKAEELW